MKKTPIWILSLLTIVLLAACGGGSAETAGIAVTDAWARPGGAGENSAVYFVIDNPGQADALLGAASPAAGAVEIHKSEQSADGVMQMHPQHGVDVAAGTSVSFEPGGLHVMLIGLTDELQAGDTISVTLNFDKAGEIELNVPVKAP